MTATAADTGRSGAPAGSIATTQKPDTKSEWLPAPRDWIAGMVSGILSGIISGFAVVYLLSNIKPKLEIFSGIAGQKMWERVENTEKKAFRVTVVNKTHDLATNIRVWLAGPSDSVPEHASEGYSLTDIRASLHRVRMVNKRERTLRIELLTDTPPPWKHNDVYDFRTHGLTKKDLEEIWEDCDSNAFFRFRITCRHAFSGFTEFFEEKFERDLVDGNFIKDDADDLSVVKPAEKKRVPPD
jgi:hypothetical protein